MFDYDTWLSTPPSENQNERDPDLWICRGGRWIYIGDDDEI